MTNWGWARIIGALVILVLGIYPMTSGTTILVATMFQIVNSVMLFLLVTFAYEWRAGQSS